MHSCGNDATVKQVHHHPAKKKFTCPRNYGKPSTNHLFVDSAGVYLPLQDEIFPDKEHFGRILEIMHI
jgi:hypothetical protein